MSLSSYRESTDKQRNGAPIYLLDMVFYVRRWGTKESQEFLKELNRKLFGPFHKSQVTDQDIIWSEWLCGYGVVGWENVLDAESGEQLEYSQEAARALFTNEEYFLSLNRDLITASTSFEHYLHEEANEDLEDLKKK
jgi:hypothetical protein